MKEDEIMCTCLDIKNKNHYFGRTLDLDRHAVEEAVITPRNYLFACKNSLTFRNKYALIGTAMVINDYPLYYEASNEVGLAMAGLNFPVNCKYNDPQEEKINLGVFEIIPYILGNYASVKELRKDLERMNFTNVAFIDQLPSSPLHYMISDKEETIVVEQMEDGLHIYENKVGVMTNNPPFNLQIENLKKYEDLTNKHVFASLPSHTCVGLGAVGLPGDFSSMSRFVKASFLRNTASFSLDEEENISTFFHILDSVSMIKGTVLNKNEDSDITFYTSCINTTLGIYYYKTYLNNQINVLRFTEDNKTNSTLTRFVLVNNQNFNYLNRI